MLNKSICIRCLNEWAKQENDISMGWNKEDIDNWKKGILICRCVYNVAINISEQPPLECVYRVEQLMKAQKC
jgi:hypothetical protein